MANSLRPFTTMKVGGEVEHLIQVRDPSDLMKDYPSPVRILGNGSNVLIDDRGLKGSVLVFRDFHMSEPVITELGGDDVQVRVSSGWFMPAFSKWAEKQGLSGVEYMVGVPGTLGGGVVLNAGANQQEFKDVFVSADLWDAHAKEVKTFGPNEINHSYRHSSLFGQSHLWVMSLCLRLRRASPADIEGRMKVNIEYRRSKTPYQKPSLGSVFTRLPKADGTWLFPGALIEAAGLKGFRMNDAAVSDVHANYIVNEGKATFDDVLALIRLIEAKVFEHSGHTMRREILIWSDR